ncbi:MAG TPA: hypothetical protein PLA94_19370 [Myxococcota bacterium]|nr:hypothetical protein [Myxococcota bacterium]
MIWLVRSAMCDMMPPVEGLPGIADTEIDTFLAQVQRETTGLVWLGLVLGALAFVCSPLFTIYIPLPTIFLSAHLRNRHAEAAFTDTPYLLRQAMFLLKMYACMCWGQHPSVRAKMGVSAYPADPGSFRV